MSEQYEATYVLAEKTTDEAMQSTGFLATAPEDDDLEVQLAYENLKRRREAKKRKRLITIAAVIIAALVAITVSVANQANEAGAAEDGNASLLITSIAYRGDFVTTISAKGATQPLSSTVVTPEVDGIIENIQVEEGTFVNAGDVLFTIKNDKLDKAVREADAKVRAAQDNVEKTDLAVDDAYRAYQDAWNECQEADDWSTFDEAGLKAAITSSETTFNDAQVALNTAVEELREAQETADKRTVRAPVSGSIVVMNAQNGAAVGSSATLDGGSASGNGSLMQIADLSQMQVTVQVNEIDIASIGEGQPAKATFSALPDLELDAQVRRIATESTGSGGADTGGVVTYAVNLVIPQPDPRLKPGMTASVNITTQSVPDALIVPVAALGDSQYGVGHATVTVVDDAETGDMHSVDVEVIAKNSSEAVVQGTLAEGDVVLMSGGADDGLDAMYVDETYGTEG